MNRRGCLEIGPSPRQFTTTTTRLAHEDGVLSRNKASRLKVHLVQSASVASQMLKENISPIKRPL